MQTNNYIKSPTSTTDKAVELLVQALEFEVINGEYLFEDGKGILLNNPHGDTLLITQQNETQPGKPVIINTPDCLKSCFQLSACGVKIIDHPYYTTDGLAAELSDQFGNRYLLIEKRSLIEN